MFEKAKPGRDAFTFSLRGMTTIASFAAPTVVADDRLAKDQDDLSQKTRLRPCGYRHVALANCA